jgi:hypothetical protein
MGARCNLCAEPFEVAQVLSVGDENLFARPALIGLALGK